MVIVAALTTYAREFPRFQLTAQSAKYAASQPTRAAAARENPAEPQQGREAPLSPRDRIDVAVSPQAQILGTL